MLYFLASNNNFRKIPLAIIRLRFKSAERDSVFFSLLFFPFFISRVNVSLDALAGGGYNNVNATATATATRQRYSNNDDDGEKKKKERKKEWKKRNTRTNVVWNYNCIQQRRRYRLSFIKQGAHWRHTTVAKLRKTWLPRKLVRTGCFKVNIGY